MSNYVGFIGYVVTLDKVRKENILSKISIVPIKDYKKTAYDNLVMYNINL